MIKLNLEVDDVKRVFNIPNKWDDVNIEVYEKLANLEKDNENEFEQSLQILAAISGMQMDDIYLLPVESMEGITKHLEFIKKPIKPKQVDSIKVGKEEYFLKKDFDKLNNGEVISLEILNKKYEEEPEKGMAEMLCLFLRKKKENGNLESFKPSMMDRADEFRKGVKIADVYHLFVFFSNGNKK